MDFMSILTLASALIPLFFQLFYGGIPFGLSLGETPSNSSTSLNPSIFGPKLPLLPTIGFGLENSTSFCSPSGQYLANLYLYEQIANAGGFAVGGREVLGEGGMAFGGMETRAETEGKGTGGMRGGGVCVAGDINPLLVKGGEKGKKSIMCVARYSLWVEKGMELVYAEGAAYEGLNGGGMVGGFELCRLGEDIYGGILNDLGRTFYDILESIYRFVSQRLTDFLGVDPGNNFGYDKFSARRHGVLIYLNRIPRIHHFAGRKKIRLRYREFYRSAYPYVVIFYLIRAIRGKAWRREAVGNLKRALGRPSRSDGQVISGGQTRITWDNGKVHGLKWRGREESPEGCRRFGIGMDMQIGEDNWGIWGPHSFPLPESDGDAFEPQNTSLPPDLPEDFTPINISLPPDAAEDFAPVNVTLPPEEESGFPPHLIPLPLDDGDAFSPENIAFPEGEEKEVESSWESHPGGAVEDVSSSEGAGDLYGEGEGEVVEDLGVFVGVVGVVEEQVIGVDLTQYRESRMCWVEVEEDDNDYDGMVELAWIPGRVEKKKPLEDSLFVDDGADGLSSLLGFVHLEDKEDFLWESSSISSGGETFSDGFADYKDDGSPFPLPINPTITEPPSSVPVSPPPVEHLPLPLPASSPVPQSVERPPFPPPSILVVEQASAEQEVEGPVEDPFSFVEELLKGGSMGHGDSAATTQSNSREATPPPVFSASLPSSSAPTATPSPPPSAPLTSSSSSVTLATAGDAISETAGGPYVQSLGGIARTSSLLQVLAEGQALGAPSVEDVMSNGKGHASMSMLRDEQGRLRRLPLSPKPTTSTTATSLYRYVGTAVKRGWEREERERMGGKGTLVADVKPITGSMGGAGMGNGGQKRGPGQPSVENMRRRVRARMDRQRESSLPSISATLSGISPAAIPFNIQ